MPEISQIEEWSDTVEARLAVLEAKAVTADAQVAGLAARTSQHEAEIVDLEDRVAALEAGDGHTDPDPIPPKTTFPGDVPQGSLWWGSAYGGNTEPGTRYGTPGRAISRTYWDMSKIAASVTRAKSDVTKGALPWVSYKVGGWAAFAAGSNDANFKKLLTDLDAIGKPVWLSVHHEPEGSGEFGTDEGTPTDRSSIDNWKACQRHVRKLMTDVGTRNIAFSSCLMSWTFDTRSGRKPAYWLDGMNDVWDFLGYDCYNDTKTPATQKYADMDMWKATVADAKARGKKIALGEWGTRGNGADITAQHADFVAKGVVGAAYFDSDLNSPTGAWLLVGDQLTAFNAKCPSSPRV